MTAQQASSTSLLGGGGTGDLPYKKWLNEPREVKLGKEKSCVCGGVNIIVVLKYVPGHHCGEPLEGIHSLNKYLLSDGSMLGTVQSLEAYQ